MYKYLSIDLHESTTLAFITRTYIHIQVLKLAKQVDELCLKIKQISSNKHHQELKQYAADTEAVPPARNIKSTQCRSNRQGSSIKPRRHSSSHCFSSRASTSADRAKHSKPTGSASLNARGVHMHPNNKDALRNRSNTMSLDAHVRNKLLEYVRNRVQGGVRPSFIDQSPRPGSYAPDPLSMYLNIDQSSKARADDDHNFAGMNAAMEVHIASSERGGRTSTKLIQTFKSKREYTRQRQVQAGVKTAVRIMAPSPSPPTTRAAAAAASASALVRGGSAEERYQAIKQDLRSGHSFYSARQ